MPLSPQLLTDLRNEGNVTIKSQTFDATDTKNFIDAIQHNEKLSELHLLENTLPPTFFSDTANCLNTHQNLTILVAKNNKYNPQSVNTDNPIQQNAKADEQDIEELINKKSKIIKKAKETQKDIREIREAIETATKIAEIHHILATLKKSLTIIYDLAIAVQKSSDKKPTQEKIEKPRSALKKDKKQQKEKQETKIDIQIALDNINAELNLIKTEDLTKIIEILDNEQINVEIITPDENSPKIIRERKGRIEINIDPPSQGTAKQELKNEINLIIMSINNIKLTEKNILELIFTVKDAISVIDEIDFSTPNDILEKISYKKVKINNDIVEILPNSKSLATQLEERNKNLKKLFMNYVLYTLSDTQELKLTDELNNQWDINADDLAQLMPHLAEAKLITDFKLTRTTIPEENLTALAEQLLDPKKFPNLETLNLSNNTIGNFFVKKIFELLSKHPTLTTFILKNTSVDYDLYKELLNQLSKNNFSITQLLVTSSKITDKDKLEKITDLEHKIVDKNINFKNNRHHFLGPAVEGSLLLQGIVNQKELTSTNVTIIEEAEEKLKRITTFNDNKLTQTLIERPLYTQGLALRTAKLLHENLQKQLAQNREIIRQSLIQHIDQSSEIESSNPLSKLPYMKTALTLLQENADFFDTHNSDDQTILLRIFNEAFLTGVNYHYITVTSTPLEEKDKKNQEKLFEDHKKFIDIPDLHTLLLTVKKFNADLAAMPVILKQVADKKNNTEIKEEIINTERRNLIQIVEANKMKNLFEPLHNYLEQIIETMQPFVVEPPKETKKQTFVKSQFSKFTSKKKQPEKSAEYFSANSHEQTNEMKQKVETKQEVRVYQKTKIYYPKTLFSQEKIEPSKNNANQVRKKKKKLTFTPEARELHSYYYIDEKEVIKKKEVPSEDKEVPSLAAEHEETEKVVVLSVAAEHTEKVVKLDHLDRVHDSHMDSYKDKLGKKSKNHAFFQKYPKFDSKSTLDDIVDPVLDVSDPLPPDDKSESHQP